MRTERRNVSKECCTYSPGYLDGDHPEVKQGKVDRDVCFFSEEDPKECVMIKSIKVVNCREFYLYYLSDVDGFERYCTLADDGHENKR